MSLAPAASEEQAAAVVESAAPRTYLCGSCNLTFKARGEVTCCQKDWDGTEKQFVCKGCNSVKTRLFKLKKMQPAAFDGWSDVSAENRHSFMQEAKSLYGSDLMKKVTQSLTMSKTQTVSNEFKETGGLLPKSEAAELPRFKNDPIAWANLLANAEKLVCPITKIEHIYVPNYEKTSTMKDVEERSKKREIEAEECTKVAKAKAKLKAEKVITKKSTLTKALAKKLDNALHYSEAACFDMQAFLLTASSPEAAAFVTPAIVASGKQACGDAEALRKQLDATANGETVDKDEVIHGIQSLQDGVEKMIDIRTKIE
eukprot:823335-Pyramimonas_sp.AAC.1